MVLKLPKNNIKGDIMKNLSIIVYSLLILILATFGGCALFSKQTLDYATGVVSLKTESQIIKAQYEKIYNIIDSRRDAFTEEEIQQLEDIHFAFTETSLKVENILNNPKDIVTPAEIKQMYELAYIGYTNAKDIIVKHKEIFTSYQWSQLESFDKKALEYDAQVRQILDNPNNTDINKAIGMIITLGGIAYKYLLPVVISMV